MNRLISFLVCICAQMIALAQMYIVYPPTSSGKIPIGHKIAVLHRSLDGEISVIQVAPDGVMLMKNRFIKGLLQPDYAKNYFVIIDANDKLSYVDSIQISQIKGLLKMQTMHKPIKEEVVIDSAFVSIYVDDALQYYATPQTVAPELREFFKAFYVFL